jgi:hypothetical protein
LSDNATDHEQPAKKAVARAGDGRYDNGQQAEDDQCDAFDQEQDPVIANRLYGRTNSRHR